MKIDYRLLNPKTVLLSMLENSSPFRTLAEWARGRGTLIKITGGRLPESPYPGAIPCFSLDSQDIVFLRPDANVIPLEVTITVQEAK